MILLFDQVHCLIPLVHFSIQLFHYQHKISLAICYFYLFADILI